MARVIEFYLPPGYKPRQRQSKTEGGKVIDFRKPIVSKSA
jgi:hypothetical protein